MKSHLSRRNFLGHSLVASSLAAAGVGFEERVLEAKETASPSVVPLPVRAPKIFPQGKIGRLSISRLICGGNLISGFAHSRDLLYVSPLLKHYFTDEKVFQTLARCEANGINTAILRVDDDTVRIVKGYREQGGKLQWIAQAKIKDDDLTSDIQRAIDHGAVGVYIHGGVGDDLVKKGQIALLAKALAHIQKQGVVGGIAGHMIEVARACEQAGMKPDFYLKTFNSKRYWSAGPMPRLDSVWEETPQETMAFMQELDTPWIAYKVLGAGAIHPREGFQYAYENGADFICAGMFDFQVEEDVTIARQALERTLRRNRPWCA